MLRSGYLSWVLFASLICADFYVSPSGHDTGNGSKKAPFATLGRAQTAVRGVNGNLTSDLYVHVAPGTYYLSQPLNFTAADSGSNGYHVIWQGASNHGGVNLSGGVPITNWTLVNQTAGIWQASTPINQESRHFYADQQHAQRARQSLDRSWLTNVNTGYQVVNDGADFLLTLDGIEHGEIHGIGSFTDRFVPIDSLGPNKTLVMAQPAFGNNIIGYDTIINPFFDNGFFVENVLALLDSENEYYLNSTTGTIFYIPPNNIDPNSMYLVLPRLEQVLCVSGTWANPVHHLTFQSFNYMHTTWNYPSTNVGYADQQTGGYIGIDTLYTIFEASRPFWWQVPGSVQASAAHDIVFSNGSMIAVMGGFGIGNDGNAHTSGVGVGAQNITITGMFFTQTGTNAITVGGLQAEAHHPSMTSMVNANNLISENIVTNTSITFKSGTGILVTYNNATQILNNDLSYLPYSGISYGYGWGSNDAGGSPQYQIRGLYNYQPIYYTPTTQTNGVIAGNVIRLFGQHMDDLGGIYTLSASPDTNITGNYIVSGSPNHPGSALYHDEGSRFYVAWNNVFNVTGNYEYGGANQWLNRNEQPTYTTGNLTAYNIAVALPDQKQEGTNQWGDAVYNISQFGSLQALTAAQKNIVYQAGIPPSERKRRHAPYNPRRA